MSMPHHFRAIVAVVIACCAASTVRADWPHLRGPNYDGVSTEKRLADHWPEDGPLRLWQRDLGQGYSGFVVADGKLYTQRQTLGGQFLLCLDPDTGDTIWETRYDWAWQPRGAYPGPYATPTWHAGKVYYSSTSGLAGCMDARNGAALWSVNVREKFKGTGFGFGYAATPLVLDDKVILPVGGPDAGLVALHTSDGRTVWSAGSDAASYCPAIPITFQQRRCIVGYLQNTLNLVELATGKVLHRQTLSSGYDEHSSWPIYREPHLLLTAPFRVPAARFELSASEGGAVACKPNWTSKELCNDVMSSVLYEDYLYGFDLKQLQASKHRTSRGSFKCLDWTGGKLHWSTDEVGHASLIAADGKLLMLNDTGSVILARADPTGYQELGRTQVFADEICWTPPTLWRGRLFVRSPSQAVCLWVGEPGRHHPHSVQRPTTPTRRWWRFDPAWLVTRERDFPNDAPAWQEMNDWFGAGILAIAAAALASAIGVWACRRYRKRDVPFALLFFPLAIVLGLLGPNAFSSLFDELLFTWPASLYMTFHAVAWTYAWSDRQPSTARARWWARLALLGFVGVGLAYFELCQVVGMFIAWTFLIGFPFAFPFTLLAVRTQRVWVAAICTLMAYAAFFWSCEILWWWKSPAT